MHLYSFGENSDSVNRVVNSVDVKNFEAKDRESYKMVSLFQHYNIIIRFKIIIY